MTGDESDLFDGTESAAPVEDGEANDGKPFDPAGQPMTLPAIAREFVAGITYDEIHALIAGFAPWYLFVVTGHPTMLALATFVTASAVGLRWKPTRPLRYILREPHWCLGGGVLGWILGGNTLAMIRLATALVEVVA